DTNEVFFYTAQPEHNRSRLGLGCAWTYETRGSQRFEELQQAFRDLQVGWAIHALDETASPTQAAAFVGFAFGADEAASAPWQAWPNTLLSVPKVLLQREAEIVSLYLSAKPEFLQMPGQRLRQIQDWLKLCKKLLAPVAEVAEKDPAVSLQLMQCEPENEVWLTQIEQARQAIHTGDFTKVVPARHLHFQASRGLQPAKIVQKLTQQFPSCTPMGIGLGASTLVAATPEKLVQLKAGRLCCDALGGTMPRSDHEQRNQQLTDELIQSPRIRREHALVVDQMVRALEPLCTSLQAAHTPAVMSLRQLQHLWTPINAQLRAGVGLLDIVARLHPTPAVAGTPTAEAQDWIKQNEPFARGWYTGAAGWLEHNGDGELSVILRCALLQGCQADLYAGAGVVADSEPAAELAETDLKLRSLLNVLGKNIAENKDSGAVSQAPRATG
ncbi:MAG TPA: isochorismate synthase, partial [Gammaproteobacteria bacterium]|nr:isochorismate synthase [Gammaproteobacteria bacterium]